jgi:hypothetical protein
MILSVVGEKTVNLEQFNSWTPWPLKSFMNSFYIFNFTLILKYNLCSSACIFWFDRLLMRKGCNASLLARLNCGKVESAGDKLPRRKGNLACLQEHTLLHTHQFQGGHGNWFRDELFLQWKHTSSHSSRRHFVAIIYRAVRERGTTGWEYWSNRPLGNVATRILL